MCSNYECKSFAELNIKACPQANGKECNGQGVSTKKTNETNNDQIGILKNVPTAFKASFLN